MCRTVFFFLFYSRNKINCSYTSKKSFTLLTSFNIQGHNRSADLLQDQLQLLSVSHCSKIWDFIHPESMLDRSPQTALCQRVPVRTIYISSLQNQHFIGGNLHQYAPRGHWRRNTQKNTSAEEGSRAWLTLLGECPSCKLQTSHL